MTYSIKRDRTQKTKYFVVDNEGNAVSEPESLDDAIARRNQLTQTEQRKHEETTPEIAEKRRKNAIYREAEKPGTVIYALKKIFPKKGSIAKSTEAGYARSVGWMAQYDPWHAERDGERYYIVHNSNGARHGPYATITRVNQELEKLRVVQLDNKGLERHGRNILQRIARLQAVHVAAATRRQQGQSIRAKVESLRAEGKSNKEIAELVGRSVRQIQRLK